MRWGFVSLFVSSFFIFAFWQGNSGAIRTKPGGHCLVFLFYSSLFWGRKRKEEGGKKERKAAKEYRKWKSRTSHSFSRPVTIHPPFSPQFPPSPPSLKLCSFFCVTSLYYPSFVHLVLDFFLSLHLKGWDGRV